MRHCFAIGLGFSLVLARGGDAQVLIDSLAAGPAPMCPAGPVALVLSGGGAKGMAHIGVILVLDSLGIRPDLVVGTSIGALIGGMYASGFSGRQIDSIARVRPFAPLFEGNYGDLPVPLAERQAWVVVEQGRWGSHLRLPAPRAREINEVLNELLLPGNLIALGNFDALPIRLRVVATDLKNAGPVVMAGGDLAQVVRASMALPLVLSPQVIDDRISVDGGLSANVPVREARAAGATRVIVSDATDHLPELTHPQSIIGWLKWLWDRANVQEVESLPGDVWVRPKVDTFPDLGFSSERVSSLIHLGEVEAHTALSNSPCPLPVAGDPPGILPRRAGEGTLSGAMAGDEGWLRTLFQLDGGDGISLADVHSALARVALSGRYEEVWLNPSGSPDSLVLDIRLRPVAQRMVALGFAYHGDVGAQVRVGALDRRLVSDGIAVSGELVLGTLRQEIRLGIRGAGRNVDNAMPALSVTFAHERLRDFDHSGEALAGRHIRELVAFVGPEYDLGGHWFAAGGVEGRLWNEPVLGNRSAAGIGARLTRTRPADAKSVQVNMSWTSAYRRVELQAGGVLALGRVRLAPGVEFGWGRSLPPQGTFMLGGTDGFPGFHIGERRGDRGVCPVGCQLSHGRPAPGSRGVCGGTNGHRRPADPTRAVAGRRSGGGGDRHAGGPDQGRVRPRDESSRDGLRSSGHVVLSR